MLDSLYRTLFQPREGVAPLTLGQTLALLLLLSVLGAFKWGALLGFETTGLILLTSGLFCLYVLGWFWLSAAAGLLAEWMGAEGRSAESSLAIAAAFWPLILTAPIAAAGPHLGKLRGLLAFLVLLWVVIGLVRAIGRAHRLSWGKAALCLVGAGLASSFGLVALVLAPVLVIAGLLAA